MELFPTLLQAHSSLVQHQEHCNVQYFIKTTTPTAAAFLSETSTTEGKQKLMKVYYTDTNTPYTTVATRHYECIHGAERHMKAKVNRKRQHQERWQSGQPYEGDQRVGLKNSRRLNCPSKALIKRIIVYEIEPNWKCSPHARKILRKEILSGKRSGKEMYGLRIDDVSTHRNHPVGPLAESQLCIDNSIIRLINARVKLGVLSLPEMKLHIREHVNQLFEPSELPSEGNTRWRPKDRDVTNHIQLALKRLMNSPDDQDTLPKKLITKKRSSKKHRSKIVPRSGGSSLLRDRQTRNQAMLLHRYDDGDAGVRDKPVYLDYNATTPHDPEVITSIHHALTDSWGNASSGHHLGQKARDVIERSREEVARVVSADTPTEIIFTSGGTESNHIVLNSLPKGSHVVTTSIEHDSILKPLEDMLCKGLLDVSFVKPQGYKVHPGDILKAITPSTKLVSVMLANNETGVLQDVAEISRLVKHHCDRTNSKIYIHTDAAQVIGKLPVSVKFLNVDYLTIVGHKLYGPRIGALYIRDGTPLQPLFLGGGQELGRRAGTENSAMIAGLGTACRLISRNLGIYTQTMQRARDALEGGIIHNLGDVVIIHGQNDNRLPNTVNLSINGTTDNLTGMEILAEAPELIAGVGAACHSSNILGSRVLKECGVSDKLAKSAIRLSVGRETSLTDIENAIVMLVHAIEKI